MKTTVNIAEGLLADAKTVAAEQGTTLRSLVDEGLRLSIARRRESTGFRMRDASFGSGGLQPDVSLERWDEVRRLVYGSSSAA